jgi:DNA gyrase/topoisomerase IV subunit A
MEIGATSRATSGVKGITLNPDDRVVCALPVRNTADKLGVFISTGMGKKIPLSELPVQKRAGKGLICYKGAGNIAAGCLVSDEDDILVCGDSNSLCISAKEIPELTRQAVGNQLIKNSNIISVSKV